MGPYDKPFSPQEYLMHYGVKVSSQTMDRFMGPTP